jgi:hypothetical protein
VDKVEWLRGSLVAMLSDISVVRLKAWRPDHPSCRTDYVPATPTPPCRASRRTRRSAPTGSPRPQIPRQGIWRPPTAVIIPAEAIHPAVGRASGATAMTNYSGDARGRGFTAAVDFVAAQPGGARKLLDRHRRRPDGHCSCCVGTPTPWPCTTASIAERAARAAGPRRPGEGTTQPNDDRA